MFRFAQLDKSIFRIGDEEKEVSNQPLLLHRTPIEHHRHYTLWVESHKTYFGEIF